MSKIAKHEFANKIIHTLTIKDDKIMLDLGKGPFDLREYLKLDEKYKLNISEAVRKDLESQIFDRMYIQDIHAYGPEIRLPSFRGTRVLKRTTVSIPVAHTVNADEHNEGLLFTYYK